MLIKDRPQMLMQPCAIHFSSLALNVSIICESNEDDAASNSAVFPTEADVHAFTIQITISEIIKSNIYTTFQRFLIQEVLFIANVKALSHV